jgi:cell division septation protein DedD
MEDQNSWKGQTFTLMIFGGIVVLCSIFFILGMLVGRTQGLKIATITAAEAATKSDPKEADEEKRPELTFYDSVEKNRPAVLEPIPAKPEPSSPAPAPARKEEPLVATSNPVTIQVAALKKSSEAEKQVEELKKKGFRAFILAPVPGDRNPFYRVQVGPLADPVEVEATRQKLDKAGYKAIVKK